MATTPWTEGDYWLTILGDRRARRVITEFGLEPSDVPAFVATAEQEAVAAGADLSSVPATWRDRVVRELQADAVGVEVEFDSPVGPRAIYWDDLDTQEIEAALPEGWTVHVDDWQLAVHLTDGRWSVPLSRPDDPSDDDDQPANHNPEPSEPCDPLPEPARCACGAVGTWSAPRLTGYNLMKRADRSRQREDFSRELAALDGGYWPRDSNDATRWMTQDRARIRKMLADGIAYLDALPARIAAGELPGWEPDV